MSQEKSIIKCPKCGEEIDVNDILYHQVDEQLKKEYNDELVKEKEKYEIQMSNLENDRQKLATEKARQEEEIAKKVNDGVKEIEIALKKKIKAEAEEEQSDAFSSLREELDEKSTKIKKIVKRNVTKK